MKIPFNKPFIVGKELFYIAQAVLAGRISGDGPFTRKCHQWLEERLGTPRALLTHSCTAALEMAAMLCDIQPGDEVIMPSYTFVSTANAFVLRGGVPVFVDIRADTLNIDERLIEAAITPRTRAIVPVHYAGVPCEMDEIMAIGARHGVFVVEDAAQGLMSDYKGRALGSIGHLGCLSFHETKNVISGEGGALLVNDPAFASRAEIIREKGTNRSQFFRGQVDKYTWVEPGSSYLPSEIIGAFLFAQLEQAESITARRIALCRRYADALQPLAEKGLIGLPQFGHGNGHMFYIMLADKSTRAELIQHLDAREVMAVFHYVPLHSAPAGRRYGRAHGELPVTDRVSNRLLRLPLYFGMLDAEHEAVVEGVETFFAHGTGSRG